jgi:hypothetical protein
MKFQETATARTSTRVTEVEDLVTPGIVDPTTPTRPALQKAASIG